MTSSNDKNWSTDQTLLYLDPWAGLSGDMFLAALLDTQETDGELEAGLRGALAGLDLGDYTLEVMSGVEWGIACTRVRVHAAETAPLRRLSDLEGILQNSGLSDSVRAHSLEAVRTLAEVEAAIHACPVSEIHFHEIGAVDTLVDIVGVLVLIEALGIDRVMVGPIPLGGGTVEIAHGRMGVPAPATTQLLKGYPVLGGPERRELTTPTGALLIRQLEAMPGPLPPMQIEKVGHGAGNAELNGGPNILRALLGRASAGSGASTDLSGEGDIVVELQTNLDDVSPEVVGHACGVLRDAGVLDVWTVPGQMKKSRLGVVVHVLVRPEAEGQAVQILMRETGTLGVRRRAISRWLAARGTVVVEVEGYEVRVKWGRWREQLVSVAPEYEDAAAVAEETGLPLKAVMRRATEKASALLAAEHPSA